MCYKNDFVQKLVQVLFLMGFFFWGGGYITFWGLMFDLTLRYRSNQNTVVLQILRQRKAPALPVGYECQRHPRLLLVSHG